MTFELTELMKSKCPNLWHDMLSAGHLNGGQIIVPDAEAQRILAGCQAVQGLGDLVAIVAQPIARAADAILGTNLANCGGCQERKEKLNGLFK